MLHSDNLVKPGSLKGELHLPRTPFITFVLEPLSLHSLVTMISPISSVGLLCLSTYLGALVESTAVPSRIFARQEGTCGGSGGLKCPTDSEKCCSQWGWCGDTAEYCGMLPLHEALMFVMFAYPI